MALEHNLKNKIDLDKGAFSLSVNWMACQPERGGLAYYPVFGFIFFSGFLLFLEIGNFFSSVMFAVSMFIVFTAAWGSATELYNAYQLWRLERQIGRPLLIPR